MKNLLFLFLFLVFLSFNYQIFAQSEEVKLIKIVSSWDGLGRPSSSKLVIEQKQGRFYANGKEVKDSLIDELLKQINSSEQQTLESLEITQQWLNENAEKNLPDRLKKSLPSEKEFFLNAFRNIRLVERILPRIFGTWTDEKGVTTYKYSTDDYPQLIVVIQKKNGSTIRIASQSQTLFMFDNPRLGRAIAALLPKNFTNRERLNGDFLAYEISKEIYDEIEEELNQLKTRNKIAAELAQLKDKYTIRKTDINYQTSIDVGWFESEKDWWKTPGFPSWNAELLRKDLPQNLIIGISLSYKENKLVTFPVFLEKIDEIVQRVLSVSWLSKYINENPDTEFEIRFVENQSFSPKAQESFLKDLKVFGANSLDKDILNMLDKSIFMEVLNTKSRDWSRQLILPDNRMVLWQINGDSIFNWKPSDFETRIMYDTKYWFQAKAIISPDGKIESR